MISLSSRMDALERFKRWRFPRRVSLHRSHVLTKESQGNTKVSMSELFDLVASLFDLIWIEKPTNPTLHMRRHCFDTGSVAVAWR